MELHNSQLGESMQRFESDSQWFLANTDMLRKKKLEGKFVAVKNKEVIASGTDIHAVVQTVEAEGNDPAYVVIEYVYPAGTVILL
jgi:transketolase N-terminal domain/subunit